MLRFMLLAAALATTAHADVYGFDTLDLGDYLVIDLPFLTPFGGQQIYGASITTDGSCAVICTTAPGGGITMFSLSSPYAGQDPYVWGDPSNQYAGFQSADLTYNVQTGELTGVYGGPAGVVVHFGAEPCPTAFLGYLGCGPGSYEFLAGGDLAEFGTFPVQLTPEPASIFFLGTIGVGYAIRRRYLRGLRQRTTAQSCDACSLTSWVHPGSLRYSNYD